jgi:hypothetical protein
MTITMEIYYHCVCILLHKGTKKIPIYNNISRKSFKFIFTQNRVDSQIVSHVCMTILRKIRRIHRGPSVNNCTAHAKQVPGWCTGPTVTSSSWCMTTMRNNLLMRSLNHIFLCCMTDAKQKMKKVPNLQHLGHKKTPTFRSGCFSSIVVT